MPFRKAVYRCPCDLSSVFLRALAKWQDRSDRLLLLNQMAGKPRVKQPKLEAFGRLLARLREQLQATRNDGVTLSHEAIARRVRAAGPHLSLVGSTLWRWEEGEVSSPDPLILRQLADIYHTSFPNLLAVLEANRSNPALDDKEAARILEESSDARPPADTRRLESFTEQTIDTAAMLIDLGDQLHRLAEALLARHVATLGLAQTTESAHHRTTRTAPRRTRPTRTRRR